MFSTNSHLRFLTVLTIILGTAGISESLELTIPDSGQIQMLKTLDGSVSFGRIVQVGADSIAFRTRFGRVSIPVSDIRDVRDVSARSVRNGEYWYPNPNGSRLLFAPTGRALKKGQGYVADHFLLFPSMTLGLSDRITIGGGVSVIPGIDMTDQLFYFTPKVSLYQSESAHLATGAFLMRVPTGDGFSDVELAAIYYGVATLGNADRSITTGLGYGRAGGHGQAVLSSHESVRDRLYHPKSGAILRNYLFIHLYALLVTPLNPSLGKTISSPFRRQNSSSGFTNIPRALSSCRITD